MEQKKLEDSSRADRSVTFTDVSTTLTSLQSKIEMSTAAEYARAGKYSEAEAILSSMERYSKENAAYCDLLARILAQQGKLSEAEKWWNRVQQVSENNATQKNSLKKIASLQRNNSKTLFFSPMLAGVIITILLLVTLYGLSSRVSEVNRMVTDLSLLLMEEQKNMKTTGKSSSSIQLVAQEGSANLDKKLESIVQQNASTQTRLAQIEQKISKTDKSIDIKINVPGVVVKEKNDGLSLSFETGLFSNGITLTQTAREAIIAIGKVLEPYANEITVSVVGYANNLPIPPGHRYIDNIGLGLARATAVVNFLRVEGGLPFSILSGRSFGEFNTPFPNDTSQNQAKNRTVIIEIKRQK